jgi:hypothetical protein
MKPLATVFLTRILTMNRLCLITSRLPALPLMLVALVLAMGLSGCQTTSLAPPEPALKVAQQPAAVESAGMIAPMVEKRETLTATGYAVISVQNHRNPAQQRLLAIRASKLDAYRSLTEQVYGQQLDASTTVADMTVQNDTFRTRVEGVIYGAVLVSITPAGEDTYETTLSLDKAVVRDLRTLYLGQMVAKNR